MKVLASQFFRQIEAMLILAQRHYFRMLLSCTLTLIIFFILPQDHHDFRWKLRKNQPIRKDLMTIYIDGENQSSQAALAQFWKTLNAAQPKGVLLLNSDLLLAHTALANSLFIASDESTREGFSGPLGFDRDTDELYRHVHITNSGQPTVFARLSQHIHSNLTLPNPMTVNFLGPTSSVPSMLLRNFSNLDNYTPHLANKWIVVDTLNSIESILSTPVGRMHRAEFSAQILQNILDKSWIRPAPLTISLFLLLMTTIFTFLISLHYSIIYSFPAFLLTLLISSYFSAFSFDVLHLWTPFLSVMIGSFMSFLNAQNLRLQLQEIRSLDLERQKKNLEDLDVLKSNFFSLISHDMKNPIAKIQAIADRRLYLSDLKDEIDAMKSIRGISEEQLKSIHNILTTVAVDSGRLPFQPQAVDISQVIRNVIKQLQPIAGVKQIQLKFNPPALFSIQLDPVLIHEIFVNIIENAIKYSPPQTTVDIEIFEYEDRLTIEIRDEGIGVEEDQINLVFEKFKRAPNAVFVSGTGLGLYLVKYFIELHNGTIKLSRRVPKGTIVTIELPVK